MTVATDELAGTLACNQGRFVDGITLLRNAGAQAQKKLAACLNNAAEAQRIAGRFDMAEAYSRESVELAVSVGDPMLEGYARNMLAHALHEGGNTEQARAMYQSAIHIRRETGTKASLASTLSSYASLLLGVGELKAAETAATEAVEILRGVDTDHPYLSTAANNLAQIYRMQQRYAEAEPLYKEAIRLAIRHYGAESRNARLLQTNFAAYYREIGRTQASATMLLRASR